MVRARQLAWQYAHARRRRPNPWRGHWWHWQQTHADASKGNSTRPQQNAGPDFDTTVATYKCTRPTQARSANNSRHIFFRFYLFPVFVFCLCFLLPTLPGSTSLGTPWSTSPSPLFSAFLFLLPGLSKSPPPPCCFPPMLFRLCLPPLFSAFVVSAQRVAVCAQPLPHCAQAQTGASGRSRA